MKKNNKGFTLIELLIVIAIIAILAGVVFVSLDPLTRFQDARNSARWTDATAILSAIKVDQVDNGGNYLSGIDSITETGTVYAVGLGGNPADATDCTATSSSRFVDLTELATQGYLARIPVSPEGAGATSWDDDITGYYLIKNGNGSLTVGACDAEGGDTITVNR